MTSVAAALEYVEEQVRIKEEAEALSKDYYAFVLAAWPEIEKNTRFKNNWHIGAVCEALTWVTIGEVKNLQIWVPPGSMKSILASILWNAWEWTSRPWLRYLSGSYADDLAEEFATKTRDVVGSEWFQLRWPHVQLRSDINAKGNFGTTEGGRRFTTSPSGGVTGRHGDRIIIDDPLKPMEIASPMALQKVNSWYDGTLSMRAGDPGEVAEVIIMQRLHTNDLAAHVLQYAEWEIVCLPERYEPSHPFLWPRDQRHTEGELLWPEQVGERENLLRARKLGAHQAAGQLQQRPTAREGGLLQRSHWKYFDRKQLDKDPGKLEFTRIITSWDTAFKEKTSSDFVVGQCWGARGGDRFLLRTVREQMSFGATKRAILEFDRWIRQVWPMVPVMHVIEKSANGVEIINELKREITAIKPWPASSDKTARAEAAQPTLEAGNCWLPGAANAQQDDYDPALTPAWVQSLVEECAQFNRGAYDDQVDAWSQAMNYLNEVTAYVGGIYVPEGDI